jgi:hypothetical protein
MIDLALSNPPRAMAVVETRTFADAESRDYNDSNISVILANAEGTIDVLNDIIETKWERPVHFHMNRFLLNCLETERFFWRSRETCRFSRCQENRIIQLKWNSFYGFD